MVFASDKNVTRDVDGFIGVPTPEKSVHPVPLGYLDEQLEPYNTKRPMPEGADLNTLQETGYWLVGTSALANTVLNLPAPPIPASGADVGKVRPASQGLLKVSETENRVMQEFYQVTNLGSQPTYRWALFRRLRASNGTTWGPWFLQEPTISVWGESEQYLAGINLNASKDSPVWIMRADARGVGTYGTLNGNTWWQSTGNGVSAPYWYSATLNSPWTNYNTGGGTYLMAAYKRTMSGIVILRGLVKGGTADTTIFTLPVGYRPAGQLVFQTITGSGYGHVYVYPDGRVVLKFNAYGAGTVGFTSLVDIKFPCAEVAPTSAWTTLSANAPFYDYRTVDAAWPAMSYWVDEIGRYWLRGLCGRASAPTSDAAYVNLPAAMTPFKQTHVHGVSNTGFSSQHHNVAGQLVWKPGGGNGVTYFSLPTHPFVTQAIAPEASWANLVPLAGGWTIYDANTFPVPGFWEAPDGIVSARGLIRAGAVGLVHTIAASYGPTPLGQSIHAINAAESIGRMDMASNALSFNLGSTTWDSLDGIAFLRES